MKIGFFIKSVVCRREHMRGEIRIRTYADAERITSTSIRINPLLSEVSCC